MRARRPWSEVETLIAYLAETYGP